MEKNEKEEKIKSKKFSKVEEDMHRLSQFFRIPKFMFKMHLNFLNHYIFFNVLHLSAWNSWTTCLAYNDCYCSPRLSTLLLSSVVSNNLEEQDNV